MATPDKTPMSEEEVLRRMLSTPPTPHKVKEAQAKKKPDAKLPRARSDK